MAKGIVKGLLKDFQNEFPKVNVDFRKSAHGDYAETLLRSDEKALFAFSGEMLDKNTVVAVATDKRLILAHKKMMSSFYTSILWNPAITINVVVNKFNSMLTINGVTLKLNKDASNAIVERIENIIIKK